MYVIILGSGKPVSIPAYVAGIKTAKANPEMLFKYGLEGFSPETGARIREQFVHSVHDRINRHIPKNGKNWESDRYWVMMRFSKHLNSRRVLRMTDIPHFLRKHINKFKHRIFNDEV